MKRFDLHVHSERSPDAKGSLMDIAVAAKAAGLDGFAITDHDRAPDLEAIRAAEAATGLIIVPGVESSTAEGHVLCYGVTRAPAKGQGVDEVVRDVHAQGGVCVAAHPLKVLSGLGPTELVVHHKGGRLAAAEGVNGRDRRLVQDNTLNLLRRLDIPATGGTDAHWITDVGTAWTNLPADVQSAEDVVLAIREGNVSADGDHLPRRKIWGHRVVFPVRSLGRKMRNQRATALVSTDDEEE